MVPPLTKTLGSAHGSVTRRTKLHGNGNGQHMGLTRQDQSRSAYMAQLNGTSTTFDGKAVWKAHAEGKHNFFCMGPK